MKNKIDSLLNVHFLSIIVVIIIILCCDIKSFKDKFLPGIPSIFFVQMIIVWSGDFNKALIIPEWYLSAMLICMLFMTPIFLLLLKLLKGIYSTIILVVIILVITIIAGFATSWKFNENIVYDMRAWGEMCVGMFSFYLSNYVKKKNCGNIMIFFFKFLELFGYGLPVIFGFLPISLSYQAYLMAITVVCEFCSVFITFAEKGNIIKNQKINSAFGYLGAISLPIYLFHPVLITLIDYINKDMSRWAKYLIVFPITIILSFLYRIIEDCLNNKFKEKEEDKEKEKENVNKEENLQNPMLEKNEEIIENSEQKQSDS